MEPLSRHAELDAEKSEKGQQNVSLLLSGIVFGLITASVLSIASVGLTMQFGVTNFVNFAYGELLTSGAYFALVFNQSLNMNIWVALVLAALIVAVESYLVNRVVIQPFIKRKARLLILLVVTIGLQLFLENAIQAIWGAGFQQYKTSPGSLLHLGPVLITVQQLVIIVVAACIMVATHMLLKFTKLGKAMRAMSDDPELARVSGIAVKRVTDITWLISGLLAGAAGVILAINTNSFTPALGANFLFVIFAAVISGGIGNPYGAIAGAVVIGVVMEVSASYIDSAYKTVVAFAILILVLLVRPQGIFRSRGRV